MSQPNLDRLHEPGSLSRIGGAAQGGSAKSKEEREALDREHGQPTDDKASGAQEATGKPGTVGGTSNDSRTDQDRAADSQQD